MEVSYITEPERNPQIKVAAVGDNLETSKFMKRVGSTSPKQVANMSPAFGVTSNNLLTLIRDVFSQEYDSQNVKMLYRQSQSRHDFSLSTENIGIRSGLPVRVFQVLQSFVMSQRNEKDKSCGLRQSGSSCSDLSLPTTEVKD